MEKVNKYEKTPAALVEEQQGTGTGGSVTMTASTPRVAQAALKVKLNLDDKPYASKADAKREIKIIRNRLCSEDHIYRLNLAQLPQGIEQGYSFTAGALKSTKSDGWISQQVFCADVDNETREGQPIENPTTVDEAAEIMQANGIEPLFMYNSFSNSEALPKFRVVVCCDEEVTDPDEAKHITMGLASLFRGADTVVKDLARIFFGSTPGSVCLPYTGKTTPKAALLALYHDRVEPLDSHPAKQNPTPQSDDDPFKGLVFDLEQAIETFPMSDYIEASSGERSQRSGFRTYFPICPLCGGHDHFDVTGSVYSARSPKCKNGGSAGNIINYLEVRHGFSRQEARDYFMSELCGVNPAENHNRWREAKRQERTPERIENPVPAGEVPDFIIEERDKAGKVKRVTVSAPLLAEHIRNNEHYIFTRKDAMGGVNRFWYSGGYYKQVSDDEIRGIIKGYIERYDLTLVRMSVVDEAFRQITTDRVFHDSSEVNGDENIINFRNGVLHLDTMTLHPHDPKYLCTRQIPVNWAEHEFDDCPNFDRFMQYLCCGTMTKKHNPRWDAGREKYMTLMEFLGATISNVKGWRLKKSLFMYGPGNTGKSQLKALAEYLLGEENCSPVDLKTLEERFGTSRIYNKRLIGSADMQYMTINELTIFKKATGGDELDAEYKGKSPFHFIYDGLCWFCCNRLPKFGGDNGEWVYDRILPIETPFVVPEALRDRRLQDKMKAEAEAIVWQAVQFLKIALDHDLEIYEPEEVKATREKYMHTNNTFDAWFDDCCVDVNNPGDEADTVEEWQAHTRNAKTCKQVYKIYCSWCKEYERGYCMSYSDFKNEVARRFGPDHQVRKSSGMVFDCFCLNADTEKEWQFGF